jgi:hypothetical protein
MLNSAQQNIKKKKPTLPFYKNEKYDNIPIYGMFIFLLLQLVLTLLELLK